MKTKEEVDALMKKWYNTPTFNLSETPGFEEFKEDMYDHLLSFFS